MPFVGAWLFLLLVFCTKGNFHDIIPEQIDGFVDTLSPFTDLC